MFCIAESDWSDPVNISNDPEHREFAGNDFVVDSNGVIHCVWSKRFNYMQVDTYAIIYYSKSEDQGDTWSEPYCLTVSDTLRRSWPKIAVDSQDNLYLVYLRDGDPQEIRCKIYNGIEWSESVTLGASNFINFDSSGHLFVDNYDRVYLFWFEGTDIKYRKYTDGIWSDTFSPYSYDNYYDALSDIVVDNANNFHCTLITAPYSNMSNTRATYCIYNYETNSWGEKTVLSNNKTTSSKLCLDGNENVHVIWAQKANNDVPPDYCLKYNFFNDEDWNEPLTIMDKDVSKFFDILNTKNDIIVFINKVLSQSELAMYLYRKSKKFFPEYVQEQMWNVTLKYDFSAKYLYSSYQGSNSEIDDSDLYFIKKSLSDSTDIINEEINENMFLSQNYPNPFNPMTTIDYMLNAPSVVNLTVYNLKGEKIKVLVEEDQKEGRYQVLWNGKDDTGRRVSSGVYFYILKTNEKELVKKMIMIR